MVCGPREIVGIQPRAVRSISICQTPAAFREKSPGLKAAPNSDQCNSLEVDTLVKYQMTSPENGEIFNLNHECQECRLNTAKHEQLLVF
jgi:hypothetical protein